MIRRSSVFFLLASALWVLSATASADPVQFSLEGPSGSRTITLESLVQRDIGYVPLQGLVEQAGGAYNVLPTRIRVDVEGSTAWLRIGEARVYALSIFSLSQNIADGGGNALIAIVDVADFFLKSFRVTVRPVSAQPDPPAAAPGTTVETPNATPAPPMEDHEAPGALEPIAGAGVLLPSITTVIIDAGHGGYDTGFVTQDTLSEANIALDVAKRVKALLEAGKRLTVILTRSDDSEIRLPDRARIVRSQPGSVFISLHLGSSPSPTAEGVAAIYPSSTATSATGATASDPRLTAESRRLAESLGAAISESTGTPLRGVVEAPLKLLGELQVPSAEIELGCLTSSADAQRLATKEYLAMLATGVFTGISAYLGDPASSAAPNGTTAVPPVN
jgi:N-acetylmuramoyl-L-alanine amidase